MAFDPNRPQENTPLDAGEVRANFNALKALIDGGSVPLGCVQAWMKNLSNTPALPPEWAECNGQVLSDLASLYDGVLLPDLNVQERFLRGNSVSGGLGGYDSFAVRTADNASVGAPFNAVTTDDSPGATPLPPYYTVVWVMRVK